MVTTRQRKILSLLVEDYISTVSPVGSESIVRKHDLGVSSATVRNELAELEEAGYISRLHPSSGAVPEDRAYRMYVESLSESWQDSPPPRIRQSVRDRLIRAEGDVDRWGAAAAELLAGLVGNMAVATFPASEESRVRHFEMVRIQELTVLLIVVLGQARLRKHLIRLQRPLEQSVLDAVATRIKGRILGLSRKEILSLERANRSSDFEDELLSATASILDAEDRASRRDHYVDGLKNLLGQPELSEGDTVRAVVGSLEDGSLIHAILDASPDEGTVKVIIGQENEGDFLRPFTVVICGYGVPGQAFGVVSALGPRRMEYSRTISGVRFVSDVMSELVEGVTA
jgi:heat-inducible transcriptional repressor